MISLNKFNKDESIHKGSLRRQVMVDLVRTTVNGLRANLAPIYITSVPGIGKTFTVNKFLNEAGIPFYRVSGNTSMFAFGIQLAVINYQNINLEPVVISVDDCDELLKDSTNCNILKNILEGEKRLVYEKSMSSIIQGLPPLQKEAIEHFSECGRMGFEVPTHNMRFIFTSNIQLPTDDEVVRSRSSSPKKSVLIAHRNAIRSRCRVLDLQLDSPEHWGWITNIVMSPDFQMANQCDPDHVKLSVDFMWDNWFTLNERSVRTVQKMCKVIEDYPEFYDYQLKSEFTRL